MCFYGTEVLGNRILCGDKLYQFRKLGILATLAKNS